MTGNQRISGGQASQTVFQYPVNLNQPPSQLAPGQSPSSGGWTSFGDRTSGLASFLADAASRGKTVMSQAGGLKIMRIWGWSEQEKRSRVEQS